MLVLIIILYNPIYHECAITLVAKFPLPLLVVLLIAAAVLIQDSYDLMTNLIFVPSEAAAFHGAGVEVALVVKLEARQARVQLIQDGRQAATQCQQLGAGAVEANTHGALQGHASSIPQQ